MSEKGPELMEGTGANEGREMLHQWFTKNLLAFNETGVLCKYI